jgi:hypothetical protein
MPMVLKAQIGGYDIGRVFMDAGSGINLIYVRTLKAMSISLEWLKPTDCPFHGIVPGSANHPLGKSELDVCFSDSGNFRREKIEFEVMDWPLQYHAILGWPAFAKFMAVPHYAYLALCYVANVSIIFDAPCLFLHQLLCVLFTLCGVFMHFPELTY